MMEALVCPTPVEESFWRSFTPNSKSFCQQTHLKKSVARDAWQQPTEQLHQGLGLTAWDWRAGADHPSSWNGFAQHPIHFINPGEPGLHVFKSIISTILVEIQHSEPPSPPIVLICSISL